MVQGRAWAGLPHLVVAAVAQRRNNDVKGLSQTLVRLGQCFEADGDKQAAQLLYRTAYPVCRKMDGVRDVADCLVGLGQVEEALVLYDQTGDVKGRERAIRSRNIT